MENTASTPAVTSYLNVYQYLQDLYAYNKKSREFFSYESWSRELGFKSRSYLRLVVIGKRSITDAFINIFCAHMNFNDTEKIYFRTLVAYSQCRSHEDKKNYGKQLIDLLKKDVDRKQIENHYDFLSSGYLPILQTLLSFEDVERTPKKLSELLQLDSKKVLSGLQKLVDLELAETHTEAGGATVWKSKDKLLKVPLQFGNAALEAYHTESLKAAIQAQKLPHNVRRFRSLLIPLGSEEYTSYLAELEEFVQQVLFKYKADELTNRRLYRVNFNAYPVSEMPRQAEISHLTLSSAVNSESLS